MSAKSQLRNQVKAIESNAKSMRDHNRQISMRKAIMDEYELDSSTVQESTV